MKKSVRVREHYRRPRISKKQGTSGEHGGSFALFLVAAIGIGFLVWVLSRIPIYVYQILAGVVGIAVILIVAFLIGIAVRNRQKDQAYQEQLRQRQMAQQQRERRTDEAQYTQELEMRLQLE